MQVIFRVFLFLLPLLKWGHVHCYLSRKLFPLTAKISTIRYRTDLAKSVLFLPFAKITFFSLRPTFFFFRTTTWYCDKHWSAVHFKHWGRKHGKLVFNLVAWVVDTLHRRYRLHRWLIDAWAECNVGYTVFCSWFLYTIKVLLYSSLLLVHLHGIQDSPWFYTWNPISGI